MNVKSKKWLTQAIGIIPADKPMIFWDTCSILDVSRVIERSTYDDFKRMEVIVSAIEKGEIISITSELVVNEYQKNVIEVDGTRISQINNLKNTINYIAGIIKRNTTKQKLLSASNLLDVEREISQLVEKLWRNTIVIRDSLTLQSLAHKRTLRENPPSKNKSQYKDCFIWSTYISLIKKMGVNSPRSIFITSNTSDYGEGTRNSTPHHELVAETQAFNGELLFSLGVLYGRLKELGVSSLQ